MNFRNGRNLFGIKNNFWKQYRNFSMKIEGKFEENWEIKFQKILGYSMVVIGWGGTKEKLSHSTKGDDTT